MYRELVAWFKRKRDDRATKVMFERKVVVSFDENGVSAAFPDGSAQKISWRDIDCVVVETNDSGPWGADVWWSLEGNGKCCAYPHGATGDSEVLAEYGRRFPDFAVRGMNSTSNARFICWQRKHAL